MTTLADHVAFYLGRWPAFEEVQIVHDGETEQIAEWNAAEPEPTSAQISAAASDARLQAWLDAHGANADKTRRQEVKDRMAAAFAPGEGTIDVNVMQLLAKRLYRAFGNYQAKINELCEVTGVDPLPDLLNIDEELTALQALADTDPQV